jgi:hypothetical protein
MKYTLAMAALLAMLAALPTTKARGETDKNLVCLQECMKPFIGTGDPNDLNRGVQSCLAKCRSQAPAELDVTVPEVGADSNHAQCSKDYRDCLRHVRDPETCTELLHSCLR